MHIYITSGNTNGGQFWFLSTEDVDLNNTTLTFQHQSLSEVSIEGGGSYIVVANTSSRDAITGDSLVVGMRVMALNERRVYERYASSWKLAEILPDLLMFEELNAGGAYSVRYCGSTGNDLTGDGSIGNPYREWQRWIDSIPPGCSGHAELSLLDAGPFVASLAVPPIKQGAAPLYLQIIGAGASILDMSEMDAGIRDANTQPDASSGGAAGKSGITRFSPGAHATITAGSHWCRGI